MAKKSNKENVAKEISAKVKSDLIQTVEELTPWFFRALPPFYYEMTPIEEQINHLHTVISLRQTNVPMATLRNTENTQVTFISVTDKPGQLLECLDQLLNVNIRGASVHSALEGNLIVDTFYTKTTKADFTTEEVKQRLENIRKILGDIAKKNKEKVEHFFNGMDQEYLQRYDDARIAQHIKFQLEIKDYETILSLDNDRDPKYSRISLCTDDPPETGYLYQVVKIMSMHGFNINRLYLNIIVPEEGPEIVLMSIYAVDREGNKISENSRLWKLFRLAAKTVKWVIDDELAQLIKVEGDDYQTFSVRKANFLRAAAAFVHQFLSKIQVERYTYEVVKKTYLRHPEIANALVDYFYARFTPDIEDICSHCGTELETRQAEQGRILERLRQMIEKVQMFVHKDVFNATIRFIDHILKTNYFIEDNIGLAFRMDPNVLDQKFYERKPFGFFFFFGRGYKGFQVRFKDMSRGGFRLVRTRDKEHYDFESTKVFDEVYGLSSAQQLKNKDIPEGGSKAIALLLPGANVKMCVESAIDSLLDVITTDKGGKLHPRIVDYYDKEEIIYLGPDENITNDRIDWIIERANARGYKYPNAFMSSKPSIGINHKEFGVTSHGVNVYVEAALRFMKIDPYKDRFTVRMAGGPDGDVAGNELKILIGSYPRVRILAISDGFGAAYDSQGLDHKELIRLVNESKSIVEYDRDLLHEGDDNYVVDASTVDGRRLRDEQQVSNKIRSDVFIPAGGRPNTINIDNWQMSLDKDGKPAMRAVVEGANLFLTHEARLKLEDKGVLVIKDSSANKGGVICSSYEIIASLILSGEEFLAIKKQYVAEVIAILKSKASMEADLLFREYSLSNCEVPLTILSAKISEEINELTDTIKSFIHEETRDQGKSARYIELLKGHCPPILVEKYGDRITTNIPEEHRMSILATQIASYIVYNEGLGWIKSLRYPDIIKVIRTYLEKDILVKDYVGKILSSDLPGKDIIAQIVEHNARKELTREALRGH